MFLKIEALNLLIKSIMQLCDKFLVIDLEMFFVIVFQDEVTVYVVQLAGVRIFSPLKRIQTGTQVVIHLSFHK